MTDNDIERLLNRYRPSDPPLELAERVLALGQAAEAGAGAAGAARSGRTWPWAVAAAALLAITIGLHAPARSRTESATTSDIAQLAARLGGDEVAWHVASFVTSEPRPRLAAATPGDPFENLR